MRSAKIEKFINSKKRHLTVEEVYQIAQAFFEYETFGNEFVRRKNALVNAFSCGSGSVFENQSQGDEIHLLDSDGRIQMCVINIQEMTYSDLEIIENDSLRKFNISLSGWNEMMMRLNSVERQVA